MKFMFTSLTSRFALTVLAAILFFSHSALAGDDWRPVTPAELQSKTPKVEPDADAEVIFWEVRVDDDNAYTGMSRVNYVRVKIFTERGREMFAKHSISYPKNYRVKDIEARITKPDGSTQFLKDEDIFERDSVKADGYKVKVKSFAAPGLEVGAILEYRYREFSDFGLMSMPLIFQREIPIQTISYYVRRYRGRARMYGQGFNVGDKWFEDDRGGYQRFTMNNLKAFRTEPDMPPENELRSWVHLYYTFESNVSKPEAYWKTWGKNTYDAAKGWLKASDEVKQTTAEVTAGAANDEEKLKKIYEFVQQRIRNLNYAWGVKPEEHKQVEGKFSASDILKLKMGNLIQVNILFGAMARAAGFDARLAYTGSRTDLTFDPGIANADLMLSSVLIAIKTGENWLFLNPGNFDLPYGMTGWTVEGQTALISDPDELVLKKIPVSAPARSMAKRSGRFKLLPDGTLEGEARIEFTGYWAAYHKAVNRFDSAQAQEKTLREYIKSTIIDTAEVDSATIANVENGNKPFIYSFKIRIPNYAARTGTRIFFQPGVFMRNSKPRYTSAARTFDIYFQYAWSEEDDFAIELPAGFSLENADSPAKIADAGGYAGDEVQLFLSKDKKTLYYRRRFSFGNKEAIRFPPSAYRGLKDMFESFNKADTHQLTLREGWFVEFVEFIEILNNDSMIQ